MQSIAKLLGYTPIDIHSHLDHGVPGDHSTVAKPETQHMHIMFPDDLRKNTMLWALSFIPRITDIRI